jgi:hypothetical protein
MVSIFLAGRAKKTVGNIISEWMAPPDGRIPAHSPNSDLMFSTTVPYTDIRPVRAALTAFSTQIIGNKVVAEPENAANLRSALYVPICKRHPEMRLRRGNIGEARVNSIIEREQAVTLYLFNNIAMRKPRRRNGVILERKKCPPDMVIISLW